MNNDNFRMNELIEKVTKLNSRVDKLYIYGAGVFAYNVYKLLKRHSIHVDAFVVTKKDTEGGNELPIIEAKDVLSNIGKEGIVLGLNQHNSRQVKKYLEEIGIPETNIIDGGNYLENGGERLGFSGDAIMEITVRIGCPVYCKYCPQDKLLRKYYSVNKDRESTLSFETFKHCLKKIPLDVGIVFSGFAEPLTNPECLDMMRLACTEGRNVDLFTTLTGADMNMVQEITKMPLNYVGLHCADKRQYAQIKTTDQYYEMVNFLINSKKPQNGQPYVDFCNSQAEPDEEIQKIVSGKYEIGTTLFDRAGNLSDEGLVRKKNLCGKLECSMCGTLANRNVLLPDGTVVLCCMDYGLMHSLGNLVEQTYDDILFSDESRKIRRGLEGDNNIDILCRHCSCAREVE